MYTYLVIGNNEIHQILLEVCHGIGWNVVTITGMRTVVLGVPAILEVIEVLPSFKAGFDFRDHVSFLYSFTNWADIQLARRPPMLFSLPDILLQVEHTDMRPKAGVTSFWFVVMTRK